MSVIDKIDAVFKNKLNEASRSSRFKDMKSIKSELDMLYDELGSALTTQVDKRTAFNDLETVVGLEHIIVRSMRSTTKLQSKLTAFQKDLKSKIKFLEKEEK